MKNVKSFKDIKNYLWLVAIFGSPILIILLLLLFQFGMKMYSCSNYGELTSRETKYSVINGCFVKTKSGWIPKSEIRSENVE